MDKVLVERIEVCDFLTMDKKFIHIKPWKSSSTLSHLFSQGKIVGTQTLQEKEYREKLQRRLN